MVFDKNEVNITKKSRQMRTTKPKRNKNLNKKWQMQTKKNTAAMLLQYIVCTD